MKRILSLLLAFVCVMTGTVVVLADSNHNLYEVGKPSSFDMLVPAIPVTDAYFENMLDNGLMEQYTPCIPGDANFNGKVDAQDALFALVYSLSVASYKAADGMIKTVPNGYPNNIYYRGFRRVGWGNSLKVAFEGNFRNYYIQKQTDPDYESMLLKIRYYRMNSALMVDVNVDDTCNSVDALYILKYVVGKIDEFPRKGTESVDENSNMFYVPWIEEWEPKMIYSLSDKSYSQLIWPPKVD